MPTKNSQWTENTGKRFKCDTDDFKASLLDLTCSQGWRLLVKIALPSGCNPVHKRRLESTPLVISPLLWHAKTSLALCSRIMRLMANQVLMRIDSFISCNYVARCFPHAKPRRLKGKQDMAWGRLGMWEQWRGDREVASSGVQGELGVHAPVGSWYQIK